MALPAELRPRKKLLVIDLVREAGVDVSDWANYADGKRSPGANPKYCYEWALGDPRRVVVCNLWWQNMVDGPDGVEQHLDLDNAPNGEDGTRRARRGRMRSLILQAHRLGSPIRVIVIDGRQRESSEEGGARISARLLDPEPWAVVRVDSNTGRIVLRRSFTARPYVDQFSRLRPDDGSAEARIGLTTTRLRSSEVRQFALARAGGVCEYCGTPGFLLPDGSIYLESHHIEPLSAGGPDSVENVVALCPNHHREAHYGRKSGRIVADLKNKLSRRGG